MKCIKELVSVLNNDKEYRQTWVANIAMAYKDEQTIYKKKHNKKTLNAMDVHIIANQAAERFLNVLCVTGGHK